MARIIEVEVESINECRIIAPIISAAILLSHNIRKDTVLIIQSLRNKDKILVVDGRTVRNLRPDFESMCGLIRSALKRRTRYGIVLKDKSKVSYSVDVMYIDVGKGMNLVDAVNSHSGMGSHALHIGAGTPLVHASTNIPIGFRRNYCISQKITIFNYIIDRVKQGIKL